MNIVDFSALAYKFVSSMTFHNSAGIQTTVAYNMLRFVKKYPRTLFACEGGGNFRKAIDSSYKSNRTSAHENFYQDCDTAKDLLRKLGYSILSYPTYEADDVIYTLCKTQEPFTIHSVDKDLLGCFAVNKAITLVLKKEKWTYDDFANTYGFCPSRFAEYKALVGDSSDNIKGIYGIGDKKAKKLLSGFSKEELSLKYGQQFVSNCQILSLTEVPGELPLDFSGSPDFDKIRQELDKLEIKSL